MHLRADHSTQKPHSPQRHSYASAPCAALASTEPQQTMPSAPLNGEVRNSVLVAENLAIQEAVDSGGQLGSPRFRSHSAKVDCRPIRYSNPSSQPPSTSTLTELSAARPTGHRSHRPHTHSLCQPSGSVGGVEGCRGSMFGGVVRGAVEPASPDHADPCAGKNSDGVCVVFAAGSCIGIDLGGPGTGASAVATRSPVFLVLLGR